MQHNSAGADDRQMNAGPRLRRAKGADADIAAGVYLRARHHAVPQIPPLVHSDDDVRQWMRGVVQEQEVWLAFASDGTVLGLMVLAGAWVGQLYVDPGICGPRMDRPWPWHPVC